MYSDTLPFLEAILVPLLSLRISCTLFYILFFILRQMWPTIQDSWNKFGITINPFFLLHFGKKKVVAINVIFGIYRFLSRNVDNYYKGTYNSY